MRKILVLLFLSTGVFAQQISVQNNELKYRTSSGIATAANKDTVAAQIANVSFDTTPINSRIVADSIRINFKVDKVTGKGLSTNDYSNAAVTTLSTNTTNIGLLQADRNTLFTSVATKVNSTQVGSQIADSLSGVSAGVSLSTNNDFTGRNTFSGNTILGSTVDSGEKLQVTGTSKFSGNIISDGNGFRDIGSSSINYRIINVKSVNARDDVYIRPLGLNYSFFVKVNNTEAMKIFSENDGGRMQLQEGGTFVDIPSARLSINSTTEGFLPPRMTEAQKNAISAPAEGLMIYQTDGTKGWYGYNGTAWVILN
jgi:hypothetical protein